MIDCMLRGRGDKEYHPIYILRKLIRPKFYFLKTMIYSEKCFGRNKRGLNFKKKVISIWCYILIPCILQQFIIEEVAGFEILIYIIASLNMNFRKCSNQIFYEVKLGQNRI